MEWKTGTPPKSGYYLIAWINHSLQTHLSVSEAWYNPDSEGSWWWNRGYTGEKRRGMGVVVTHKIIAWMEMPEPPNFPESKDESTTTSNRSA